MLTFLVEKQKKLGVNFSIFGFWEHLFEWGAWENKESLHEGGRCFEALFWEINNSYIEEEITWIGTLT